MSAALKDEYSGWPETLREVAEVIGREPALKLASECGGIDIYVPSEPETPRHIWYVSVGAEAFAKLARVFGGQRVQLPRGVYVDAARPRILELAAKGMTKRRIALTLKVTERYVRMVLAGRADAVVDDRQGKLF